jgi:hypothetical protein
MAIKSGNASSVVLRVANGRRVGRQTELADSTSMITIRGEVKSASLKRNRFVLAGKINFTGANLGFIVVNI